MIEGFIQLHRKLIEWEWYDDLPTFKLFIHLLLKANYKTKIWRGETIERGQLKTSISHLAHETGLSEKQIRTALNKLIKTGEVGKATTSHSTVITVLSYNSYQDKGKPLDTPRASEGQAEGKAGATTNKVNKVNKEKKVNNILLEKESKEEIETIQEEKIEFDFFWNLYDKKIGDLKKCKKKWDGFDFEKQSKILHHVEQYVIHTPDKKFRANPETYFNQERWTNEIINQSNESNKKHNSKGVTDDELARTLHDHFLKQREQNGSTS